MMSAQRTQGTVSERHRYLPKAEITALLNLQPGMNVTEIGAGSGDLILPGAEVVAPTGHAFATESASQDLARLRERSLGHQNVHVIESPYHVTPLASHSNDRVLMANLWNELPDPVETLRESARLLRERGRLVLIEQRADFSQVVETLEKNTWDVHRQGEAGPQCYFIEASVSDESVQS
jgi:ubiquinone/menaquinone biosynthesis C-methylase UbiE